MRTTNPCPQCSKPTFAASPGYRRCRSCEWYGLEPSRPTNPDRPHLVNGYELTEEEYTAVQKLRRRRDIAIITAKREYENDLTALLTKRRR